METQTPSRSSGDALPGHAPLRSYYQTDDNRHRYVIDLFNETAQHYNTIEALLLNGGLWYRYWSLKRAGLKRGMKVLDVAIGTAAVARNATKLVGPEGMVIGHDPSRGMLGQARKVFHGPLSQGVAEFLPYKTGTFDFVTMGIALRHVADLKATFAEYFRVLKPGGTVWILEGHSPASKVGHWFTHLMMAKVIPGMTLLATRDRRAKELMDYYWDTVEESVPPKQLVETIEGVGFENVRHTVVSPVCEYVGRKPL